MASKKERAHRSHKYYMCGRCRHRWRAVYIPDPDGHREPPRDEYGWQIHTPPPVACPECGSRYSVRSFLDLSVNAETERAIANLDPFTAEDIPGPPPKPPRVRKRAVAK